MKYYLYNFIIYSIFKTSVKKDAERKVLINGSRSLKQGFNYFSNRFVFFLFPHPQLLRKGFSFNYRTVIYTTHVVSLSHLGQTTLAVRVSRVVDKCL